MLRREVQVFGKPEEKVLSDLMHSYNIMKNSTKKALNEDLKSMGGLLGGEEKLIMARKDKKIRANGLLDISLPWVCTNTRFLH